MADDRVEFLTVADAARLLKVSRATVHRWLKLGQLRAYHVGPRVVRIKQEDLDHVIVPTQRAAVLLHTEADPIATTFAGVRPPTEKEKRRALEAIAQARELGAAILARRSGEPVAESWPIIREAREERAEEPG